VRQHLDIVKPMITASIRASMLQQQKKYNLAALLNQAGMAKRDWR